MYVAKLDRPDLNVILAIAKIVARKNVKSRI